MSDGYDDDRCVFPGECLMPGEHLSSECHTVEMMEAQEAEHLAPESLADYCERRAREIREEGNIKVADGQESSSCGDMAMSLVWKLRAAQDYGAARALEEIAVFERRQGR